jgi:glycosyltransferase involved in cell wall biosynthesis
MPSPYQRETFKAISSSSSFKVTVDYFAATAGDRHWAREALEPYETILPGIQFLRGGASGRFNPAIFRRLHEVHADLVVLSDYSAPTVQIAMRVLSASGRPWVYCGELPGVNARGAFGLWVRRRLQHPLRGATAIAAIGSRAATAYHALFPHVPVFDIPYFCDIDHFRRAAKTRSRAQTDRVRILFSGQLIARKGIDLLMHAFQDAVQHAPNLELNILGDGPMRSDLERIAASTPGRVIFLGHRAPAELPSVFAEADLFVLPSRHDGWGVVINEALGAGLPIVASDGVGAAHDLIAHGVNGLITPAGDAHALRDALVLLGRDPARRRAMADASRNRAADWGLEEGVHRWKYLCGEILGRGAAANCVPGGTIA